MVSVRLANVLLEPCERMALYQDLYVRTESFVVPSAGDTYGAVLPAGGRYDFMTYYNSCSAVKYRMYTAAHSLGLHLKIKGRGVVMIESASLYSSEATRSLVDSFEFDEGDFASFDIELPDDGSVLFSFEILAYDACEIDDSYYYALVDEADIRPVRLSIAMTTFKNEKYVLPNIEQFKNLINGPQGLGDDLAVHVVDNGRTLDAEGITGDGVYVHPNPNVGGSGGFARGMMESLHQDVKPTHVILMDDDVSISPESIRRTYNLLSVRAEKYKDAFLNGAMLQLEVPYNQFEDVAFVRDSALYDRVKPDLDMKDLKDIVRNETIDVEKDNAYGAWWFCCIPANIIEEKGLPLPLFVRCDDVEYGLRCQPLMMSMGGICVWHSAFGGRFKASVDLYQYTRNFLITLASTSAKMQDEFLERYWNYVRLSLKKFDYAGAELLLDALEDYMRGPDFIRHTSGESIIKRNGGKNEVLVPLKEIEGVNLNEFCLDPEIVFDEEEPPRGFMERVLDYTSFGGHRLPEFMLNDEPSVIPAGGFWYPAKRMHRRRRLLAVDSDVATGNLRVMDKPRFKQIMKRYKKLIRELNQNKHALVEAYSAAAREFHTEEFWKAYLEEMSTK